MCKYSKTEIIDNSVDDIIKDIINSPAKQYSKEIGIMKNIDK